MIWTIEFNESLNLVKVVFEGESSIDEYLQAKKDYLSSPYWRPGTNILVDLRQTILIYPGINELRRSVNFNVSRRDEYGACRIAYLVKDSRDYGIARQITSLLQIHTECEADAFLSEKVAMEWLTVSVPQERLPCE